MKARLVLGGAIRQMLFVLCREEANSRTHNRVRECESYFDLSLYLDGDSVDRRGTVAPVPDGFEGGFDEPRVTRSG